MQTKCFLLISAVCLIIASAFSWYLGLFIGADPMGIRNFLFIVVYGIFWGVPSVISVVIWWILRKRDTITTST